MKMIANDNNYLQRGFQALADAARLVSADTADEVDQVLRAGREEPLTQEEAARVLGKAIFVLRQGAAKRNDQATLKALEGDVDEVVRRIMLRSEIQASHLENGQDKMLLVEYNSFVPRPVFPTPHLLGLDIPMMEGYVRTVDIMPWDGNPRLDIHLAQFRKKHGRSPEPDELREIMRSESSLPGISSTTGDEFEIKSLAQDIAASGVRVPPTIHKDGTLLDGNRRVTACYYILASDKFDAEAKQRVRYIFVRQLTAHATDQHKEAVVTGYNFPPDYRKEWPYYVKARRMYDAWLDKRAGELRPPTDARKRQMRKELAESFAVDPSDVLRYIEMVELAIEFEDYHVNISEAKKDEYVVKHHANEYFQYFDELGKGPKPGGVFHTLNQDENFKHTVFDLLFDGKFNNWREIRALKNVYTTPEAMELLKQARQEPNRNDGRQLVVEACGLAQIKNADNRSLGANTRIEVFIEWLRKLPLDSLSNEALISTNSLRLLHEGFEISENQVVPVLKKRGVIV